MVKSERRVCKEMAMRRRVVKKLWRRLTELRQMNISRDQLLQKIGAAKQQAGRLAGLIRIHLPKKDEEITEETFRFEIDKTRMKKRRRHEGRYLLRSNLVEGDPSRLWENYLQLTEVEQAFKELKSDLSVRPIYHQKESRIEAHVFVAFQAYCLNVTLKQLARRSAAGLTPRAILEKMGRIQMVDVHLPTTDGRVIVLTRYTKPEKDHELLLNRLSLELPEQPVPRVLRARISTPSLGEGNYAGSGQTTPILSRSRGRAYRRRDHQRKKPQVQFCRGDFSLPPPQFTRVCRSRAP